MVTQAEPTQYLPSRQRLRKHGAAACVRSDSVSAAIADSRLQLQMFGCSCRGTRLQLQVLGCILGCNCRCSAAIADVQLQLQMFGCNCRCSRLQLQILGCNCRCSAAIAELLSCNCRFQIHSAGSPPKRGSEQKQLNCNCRLQIHSAGSPPRRNCSAALHCRYTERSGWFPGGSECIVHTSWMQQVS